MTDIDDATCKSSYGATLVAAGGTGLVAWTKQLSKKQNSWYLQYFPKIM